MQRAVQYQESGVPKHSALCDNGVMSGRDSVVRLERDLLNLGKQGLDKDSWCRAADDLLRAVTPFDGSCWHTIDPATLLITGHLTLNLPNRFPLLAANECLGEDVNKFVDLAAAPSPVGTLERATEGRPERSLRFREMLVPNGFASELRVSFVDGKDCWGSLILVRDRGRADFDDAEVVAIENLAGLLARSLRRLVVTAEVAVGPAADGPGLVVLDRRGEVESLTPSARHWLEQLGGDPPPVVLSVAAAARRGGEARARARTPKGQWLVFHGARLDGDPEGKLSVIVEPPRPRRPCPAHRRRLRAVRAGTGSDRARATGPVHLPNRPSVVDLSLHGSGASQVDLREGRCAQSRRVGGPGLLSPLPARNRGLTSGPWLPLASFLSRV